jgi:hypothetical protein
VRDQAGDVSALDAEGTRDLDRPLNDGNRHRAWAGINRLDCGTFGVPRRNVTIFAVQWIQARVIRTGIGPRAAIDRELIPKKLSVSIPTETDTLNSNPQQGRTRTHLAAAKATS